MAHVKIMPDVMDVLNRARIDGNALFLPSGQLPRELYDRVNKALTNAGGKWNRSKAAHLFPTDPSEKLGIALATGVSIDERKRDQAFFTPRGLADLVAYRCNVKGQQVFEPSAGEGALAEAAMRAGAKEVLCIESNPERVAILEKKGFVTKALDFLEMIPVPMMPRIVMNPPFTKNQDCQHVAHAMRFLEPGGTLVAIMSGNTTRPRFGALLSAIEAMGYGFRFEGIAAGEFKESGTNVATIMLFVS